MGQGPNKVLCHQLPNQHCPDGEIGRRSGLKIRRPQGRAGSSPPLGTNMLNQIHNVDLSLAELPVGLVPPFSVLLPSGCEVIPRRDEPLKRNAASLRKSLIPVFGGSDTKLAALSIARRWAVEATPSSCMQSRRPSVATEYRHFHVLPGPSLFLRGMTLFP
jgi:hypothetical protein